VESTEEVAVDREAQDGERSTGRSYLPLVEQHLQNLTSSGLDVYGPRQTAMWMAIIDTRTGRHPEFEHTPKRVYREIGAPRGSSLYWDQPMIVAAHRLSELTGDPRYRRAAERYVRDFLATSVDAGGMFQWGNHCYYDAFADRVRRFSGGYHELRPHVPAWDLFWREDPETCERYIRELAARHLHDPATGGFNRHDNGRKEHAFLEAGGVLVESLAWLHGKTRDPKVVDLALRIADYSFRHRGESTGLIINNPGGGRWDSKVCTTEVGLWAMCLLRSAEYTSSDKFTQMASEAVSSYLKHGYDESTGRYFGQLSVESGKPVVPEKTGYWPRKYSEVWNADQWPTHDYPMAMAEACVILHRETGDPVFRRAIDRWAEIIRRSTTSDRKTAYAGQYGACIRFLTRAAIELETPDLLIEARELADEAVERLYENGWFQGYPRSHLYESVDGVGDFVLALLELEALSPDRKSRAP
jgi:hypothetical protein